MKLLVLRPQVGADATAARAVRLGHDAVVAPLFRYRALGWTPPATRPDALLFTSAAAVRLGGDALGHYHDLPVFAVGTATADAARAAGFADVRAGDGDVAAAVALLADAGHVDVLHPCGRDRQPVCAGGLRLHPVTVYAADAADRLPDAVIPALDDGAVVLLHSPRAARTFGRLLDASGRARGTVRLAGFSPAVAHAAGTGWAQVAVAERPADDALFAAAARLCDQNGDGARERR